MGCRKVSACLSSSSNPVVFKHIHHLSLPIIIPLDHTPLPRHDLPPHDVGGQAEDGSVVHLAFGRVVEEAGGTLVGEGVSGQVHAAGGGVEGPGEALGLWIRVDAARNMSGFSLRDTVNGLVFDTNGLICFSREKREWFSYLLYRDESKAFCHHFSCDIYFPFSGFF